MELFQQRGDGGGVAAEMGSSQLLAAQPSGEGLGKRELNMPVGERTCRLKLSFLNLG